MKNNQLKQKDQDNLLEVKRYITANVAKDLSIAILAKKFSLNRDKIKWGFKALFGVTVHHYIMEQRMLRAKAYLLETDKPLKEIAAQIGYSERSFFTTFKRYFFQTPASFRKQHPGGKQSTLF